MTQALIVAAIATGTSFGLNWTNEQVGSITGFTALLLAYLARMLVTPNQKFDNAVNAEAENIAEAIVTDRAEPLTPEERASLDALRAERDSLRRDMARRRP
jgi:hypothetical protein